MTRLGAVAVAMAIVARGVRLVEGRAPRAATDGTSGAGGDLNLVAYSTPQAAYEPIEAAFNKTPAGKDVKFTQSYGASGDQSRAVDGGQPADYVDFSLEPDMTRLVKSGKVAADWNTNQYKGIVTDSVVVFVVRKGNPKNIKTWDDLTKPGVEVVTPNPFSSGARPLEHHGRPTAPRSSRARPPAEAEQYLQRPVRERRGAGRQRPARRCSTFTGGKGDVLLSYENEAIFAQQNGQDIDYVVPDQTILIENPVAVTIDSANPTAAKACSTSSTRPRRRRSSPTTATGRSCRASCPTTSSRRRPGCSPSPTSAAGPTWPTKFFDTKTGIVADIEQDIGVAGCLQVATGRPAVPPEPLRRHRRARPRRRTAPASSTGIELGHRHAVPQLPRA